MGTALLSCVLLLLWPCSARADVLVQPDFDANKFSGLWYVVSMVSDCKVFLGKKDHLLMSTRDITASAGGNLSVHMEFPRLGLPGRARSEHGLQLLRRGLYLQGAGGRAQHRGATLQCVLPGRQGCTLRAPATQLGPSQGEPEQRSCHPESS
ncbi:lipocalin-15-like isoform X2 [Moschus berezovskii]|uniref:lipocalin-15-like isoform X2 n=1 Tax=Moschus berezovskii TaxID=68408 RepID=UPI002444616F|nr:lipocalin-15-like isoform X2 [Moschus berezovskii]